MKALLDDDPHSFSQQADVHCAYCNGAYDQVGFPNLELQLRASSHQPPTLIDLDFNGTDETMSNDMVSNSNKPLLFFGSPLRAGTEPDRGSGSIEGTPHGPVHRWTGDNTQPNFEDMGNFYSAARDPIFFSHHSNVTVRDSLDNKKLGYTYEDVEIPWLKSKPMPRRTKLAKMAKAAGVAKAAETTSLGKVVAGKDFPINLETKISTVVPRLKQKKRSNKEKEDEEEILVIEGIELEKDVAVKFDVNVNDVDEDDDVAPSEPDKNVPHKQKEKKKSKSCLRLGLTDLLEDLGAEDDESVVVTLVPRYGAQAVKIGSIKIEFLA
ncbi:polyphenol oxidase [Pyrus ussuriensis x Pyrus communis]|uniref:Polyphenol oxidase n=1 Tax=Pyrus ussuriensis x Pyrus communis TaxID=2448454 RepID=A0A5N5IDQ7_9ROSA|nr:polyphenol oxidase [Pyrus ussuriensis x Pyrus communis]